MNGQLHTPAALPTAKEVPVPIKLECRWVSEVVGTFRSPLTSGTEISK